MVITNGFPKSGNHALVKAVQLLGQPCEVNHIEHGNPIDGKHVFIKRDPRNVVCSWLRFNGQPVTPGMFLTAFRQFQDRSLVEKMASFEGLLSSPDTFVIEYEDLIASDTTMLAIADFLGVPYLDGAFEDLPGLTVTWNEIHSDYHLIWTPEVDAAWNAEGGAELLTRWGY